MLQAQADHLLRMAVVTDDSELRSESILLCERLESLEHYPPYKRERLYTAKSIGR